MKKTSFILILGFILISVPLTSSLFNLKNRTAEVDFPSTSAAPVITAMGAGIYDLDLVWDNYTGFGPYLFDHPSWALYWYVNYTSDAPIWYYYFNMTYGSLNGYNGTFTPLYDTQGPGLSYDNKMNCFESSNPDELVNFGWEVKVWIEDSDGLVSVPVTKLFKYYNGTIEDPMEELEFTATPDAPIINPNETIVIDFDISDPDGPRTYQVNYSCDYENFEEISYADVTPAAAIFTPGVSLHNYWVDRVTFNFTFNLTVWESSVMVDSKIDTAMVYVTSPPENGTCSVTEVDRSDTSIYTYNISCSGWEDELDGDALFYRCISQYEISNPGSVPMHEETNTTDFQLVVSLRDAGTIYLRVYDSHGGYAQIKIGSLGKITNLPPSIPGYSISLMFLAIVPLVATIIWKIKKKQ